GEFRWIWVTSPRRRIAREPGGRTLVGVDPGGIEPRERQCFVTVRRSRLRYAALPSEPLKISDTTWAPAVSVDGTVTVAYVSQPPVDANGWFATAFAPST